MKRGLAAALALCLLLVWQQALERCRKANLRAQSARQELLSFEESLKEWPQLRLQAQRLESSNPTDPNLMKHREALQVSFTREQLAYRMRLSGPRSAALAELRDLTHHFWLQSLELRSSNGDQVIGEALLQAVP